MKGQYGRGGLRRLGQDYGVSHETIRLAVLEETWKTPANETNKKEDN